MKSRVIDRSIRFVLSGAALCLGLLGCGPTSSSDSPLKVGMELAYPPFEMRDTQGEPTGVSVEIARALGQHFGRAIQIENIAFDGLIPALKTGKIDLIISSMTATEERARSIDFSESYLKTGLCLLVGKDASIESFNDLLIGSGKVAVKNGTTGHQYVVRQLPPHRTLVLDSESSCVLEVVQGKADAFIYDQMSTYQNWQRNPETTRAILNPFQQEAWAVGVRRGRAELLAKVNAFLRDFREKGGFDRLGDQYLSEQKAAFEDLSIPFYF